MKLSILVICVLVATSLLISDIECLKCYNCDNCGNDPFKPTAATQETCPTDGNYSCVKGKATASGLSGTARGCLKDCLDTTLSQSGTTISVRCCKTDLCNGSNVLHKSSNVLITFLFSIAFSMLFK